jgi:hypothetical protein
MAGKHSRRLALLEAAGHLVGEAKALSDAQLWDVIRAGVPAGAEVPDLATSTEAETDAFLHRVGQGQA